ncbi:adenosine monophosphate-protein transferase FICD [Ditylenchus destructor]|nr:adenosine monophosphate-protein transferase FICD [Ditylenchus destructor]
MSAESSSTSPLQRVNVRKLVKDYITDHFLRANINLRSSVCGILIGDAGDTITVSNSFPVENMKQLRDAKNLRDKYFPKEEIELYRGSFTHSDRSNSHILGYYCCGSNLALSVHQKIIAQMRRDNGEAHIVLLQKDIGSQLDVYQLLNNKFQQTVEDLQETVVVIGTEEYKVDWPANEIFVRMSLATDPNSPVLNAERFCSRIGKYSKAFARQIPFDTLKKPAPPSLWRKMQKMYESFMTSGEIQNAVTTSEALRSEDKIDLAYDLIQNKLKAYPLNYMLNQEFGHILRTLLPDSAVIMAYIQYNMALETAPEHAKENLIRYIDETSGAVDKQIDAKFIEIQKLMKEYNKIPRSNPYLNSALRELYYVQIYETLKIEGNKLSPDEMKQLIEGKRIKGQAMKDHRESHL